MLKFKRRRVWRSLDSRKILYLTLKKSQNNLWTKSTQLLMIPLKISQWLQKSKPLSHLRSKRSHFKTTRTNSTWEPCGSETRRSRWRFNSTQGQLERISSLTIASLMPVLKCKSIKQRVAAIFRWTRRTRMQGQKWAMAKDSSLARWPPIESASHLEMTIAWTISIFWLSIMEMI